MGSKIKYRVTAKVANAGKGYYSVTYEHVNNLRLFAGFLFKVFPTWTYMNVIDRASGKVLKRFTRYNPPSMVRLSEQDIDHGAYPSSAPTVARPLSRRTDWSTLTYERFQR